MVIFDRRFSDCVMMVKINLTDSSKSIHVQDCHINRNYCNVFILGCFEHWRKSRGGGGMGGIHPPTFLGGGDGLYKYPPPPLFEDKIISNLTFIVKKLTFLTVKLLKTQKNRSLAHKCILTSEIWSLRFCQYSFLDIIYVKKGVE